MSPRPVKWLLHLLALVAGGCQLLLSPLVAQSEGFGGITSSLFVVLSVVALVQSLRVAFPWPFKRADAPIQNSARRAVFFDGVVAAVCLLLAVASLFRRGPHDGQTLALLLLAFSPLLLVAPVLLHYGPHVLRFWRPIRFTA